MTTYPPPKKDRWPDDYIKMGERLAVVEQQLANGAGAYAAFSCTSASHPANPKVGAQILETDTGLFAWWSGTAWIYPPQLITSAVLGAAAASVRLPAVGSLPQVFRNLRVEISAQSSSTAGTTGYDSASMQINGITANYNWNSIFVTQGAGAGSVFGTNAVASAQVMEVWNSHFGSAGRGIATIEIPAYSDPTCLKSWTSESTATDGGTAGILQIYGGSLGASNVAAVSSLTLTMGAGTFLPGSTFNVYGS